MVDSNPQASRRQVLTVGAGFLAAGASWVQAPPAAHAAVSAKGLPRTGASANGWPLLASAPPVVIEGTNVAAAVVAGDVAVILGHVVRRFHYEIDLLDPADVTSHGTQPSSTEAYETNYASGTAVAILPDLYSVGVSGAFYPHQVVVIRDILAECEAVVRWGGDETQPKESHFHIDTGPRDPRVKRLATKIMSWDMSSSRAPGGVDTADPARLRAAAAVRQEQKKQ